MFTPFLMVTVKKIMSKWYLLGGFKLDKCPRCGAVAEHKKILIRKNVCADCLAYTGYRCVKCGYEWTIELLMEDENGTKNR